MTQTDGMFVKCFPHGSNFTLKASQFILIFTATKGLSRDFQQAISQEIDPTCLQLHVLISPIYLLLLVGEYLLFPELEVDYSYTKYLLCKRLFPYHSPIPSTRPSIAESLLYSHFTPNSLKHTSRPHRILVSIHPYLYPLIGNGFCTRKFCCTSQNYRSWDILKFRLLHLK